jgi:hypothetical protein
VSEEYISRFALILLRDNGHLGEFEVDVLDIALAARLSEHFVKLGCQTKLSEYGGLLTVTCPPEALKEALAQTPTAASATD